MKRKVNRFSDEIRLQAAQEYLTTDISLESLREKYGFSSDNSVYNWIRKFGLKKPSSKEVQIQRVMKTENGKSKQDQALETRIRELEKALEYEKLKTMALNKMIDIAERDLKITIRKKSGTKQ